MPITAQCGITTQAGIVPKIAKKTESVGNNLFNVAKGLLADSTPTDLWMWSIEDLQGLNYWLNKGFRFGGVWTSSGLNNVVQALDWLKNSLTQEVGGGSSLVQALFNIGGNGQTFTFLACGTCHSGSANYAHGESNMITFDSPDVSIPLVLHEMGHIIDYNLARYLNPAPNWWAVWETKHDFWSETHLSGWENGVYNKASKARAYSTFDTKEDFADTLVAWVLTTNQQPLPAVPASDPTQWQIPSEKRLRDLTTALGQVLNQLP